MPSQQTMPTATYKALPIIMFLLSMMVRPTIIGQDYTIFGTLSIFVVSIACASLLKIDYKILRKNIYFSIIVSIFWIFIFFHSLLNEVNTLFPLYAMINNIICVISLSIILSDQDFSNKYFNCFDVWFAASGLSYVITVIIAGRSGISSLGIFTINVSRYEGISGQVYFPFTFGYGLQDYGFSLLPRLAAGFRESGIAQCFIASRIIAFPENTGRGWLLKISLLFIAGVETLSTTGLIVITYSILIRFVFFSKSSRSIRILSMLLMIPLLIVMIDTAINSDSIGLENKYGTDSYADRKNQMDDGILLFFRNPFGVGLYNSIAPGINLISLSGSIGIFGIFLYASIVAASCVVSDDRIKKFFYIIPILFTAITSQPLLDAPLVYIFWLLYLHKGNNS